jgi:hypothetical protein
MQVRPTAILSSGFRIQLIEYQRSIEENRELFVSDQGAKVVKDTRDKLQKQKTNLFRLKKRSQMTIDEQSLAE